MRLCFVTSEYITEPTFSGGLANYLARITSALSDQGHEVHVITRSTSNESLKHGGATVHRVVPLWDLRMILDHADPLVPRVFYSPYQDLKAAWCLWHRWRQLRRNQRFDLVQVTNVMASGLFFRFENTVPVVTRMSSYRPYWDNAAAIPETAGVRLRWAMERLAVKGTRYVYAPSQFVSGLVERNYKIPDVPIIESPFVLEEFSQENLHGIRIDTDSPFCLFFGSMTQMKGTHLFTEALPRVMKALPDFRMVMVGRDGIAPGGGSMKRYLASCLAEFKDRIEILDPLRKPELYPLLRKSRLVVLPSLHDNLPNTCIEAMGYARPVIATSGSCFEQLIDDGRSGYLVSPGDPRSLGAMIETVWRLPDKELREVGERARERIDLLSPAVSVPSLLDYFASVVRDFGGNLQPRSRLRS